VSVFRSDAVSAEQRFPAQLPLAHWFDCVQAVPAGCFAVQTKEEPTVGVALVQ
jgi:hypothetical protein